MSGDEAADFHLDVRDISALKASSVFIVGCSPFAGIYQPLEGGESTAKAIVEAAIAEGIEDFDTAPHYGLGRSEERLGRAMHQAAKGGRVWTKVGRVILRGDEAKQALETESSRGAIEVDNLPGSATTVFPESPSDAVPLLDYSDSGVIRSYSDSLLRLGMEGVSANRLVGLRLHDAESYDRFCASTAPGGAVEGLLRLRSEGKIAHVSLGLNDAKYILMFLEKCRPGTFNSVMMAGCWNLIDQTDEGFKVLQKCEELGIEVHLAGVFASGLLVGQGTYKYSTAPADKIERTKQWTVLCEKHSIPLPAVALAFCLLPSVVKRVAIGVKSPFELHQSVKWLQNYNVPTSLWKEAVDSDLLPEWIPLPPL